MINWLVDRMHVGATDEEVIAEFNRRMDDSKKMVFTPEARKEIIDRALTRHHHNQMIYNAVYRGQFGMRCKGKCPDCGDE